MPQIWAGPINWEEPVQVLRHADRLLRAANGEPVRSPSEASGRTVLPPPAPPAPAQAMPTPVLNQSSPQPQQQMPQITTQPAKNYTLPAIIAAAGLVLVGLVTVIAWPSDDSDEEETADAVAVAEVAEEEPADPAPEAEPEDAEPDPVAAAADPSQAPAPAVEAVPEPAPEPEAVVVPEEGPVEYAATEDDRIDDALKNQSIRALDILLVSPEARVQRRKRLKTAWNRFPAADAYCAALSIEGVDGWRLPTAGELASITTANMLKRSSYWSSTHGDSYGNTRIVWNVYRKRMRNASQRFRAARTVCVRDHVER